MTRWRWRIFDSAEPRAIGQIEEDLTSVGKRLAAEMMGIGASETAVSVANFRFSGR